MERERWKIPLLRGFLLWRSWLVSNYPVKGALEYVLSGLGSTAQFVAVYVYTAMLFMNRYSPA